MKIAVCVKHAIDETELRVDSGGRPQLEGAAAKMSTFDKNAVEEALRLRSALGGEVVSFSLGSADARKTVKETLAMGADRGVHILADHSGIDTLRIAELLSAAITKEGPFDLVLCSEGSSDIYAGLVPAMLAELLGFAYVGYARKIGVSARIATVERSLEESVEAVEAPVPLVVSVVSEINEPRYPTLIQIMQASKKPVQELEAGQLAPTKSHPPVTVISMSAQPTSRKRIMIEGSPDDAATKLVEALEKEGVLSK